MSRDRESDRFSSPFFCSECSREKNEIVEIEVEVDDPDQYIPEHDYILRDCPNGDHNFNPEVERDQIANILTYESDMEDHMTESRKLNNTFLEGSA